MLDLWDTVSAKTFQTYSLYTPTHIKTFTSDVEAASLSRSSKLKEGGGLTELALKPAMKHTSPFLYLFCSALASGLMKVIVESVGSPAKPPWADWLFSWRACRTLKFHIHPSLSPPSVSPSRSQLKPRWCREAGEGGGGDLNYNAVFLPHCI